MRQTYEEFVAATERELADIRDQGGPDLGAWSVIECDCADPQCRGWRLHFGVWAAGQ